MIINYLLNFRDLIQNLNYITINYKELVSYIAKKMNFKKVNKENIVYKTGKYLIKIGDISDQFYIIIKGKVSVFIPIETKIMISEEEYLQYLSRLKKFNENEIFDQMISKKIFYIKGKDVEKIKSDSISKCKNILCSQSTNHNSNQENNFDKFQKTVIPLLYEERIKPIVSSDDYSNKKEVILINYFKLKSLHRGDYFGQTGLAFSPSKRYYIIYNRTESVITIEDCIFGVIDKEAFDEGIKEVLEKHTIKEINFILSTKIFNELDSNQLIKSFNNNFVLEHCEKNYILIKNNEEPKFTYLIKTGEFEVSIKSSLIHINKIIEYFGGVNLNKKEEEYDYNRNEELKRFYSKNFIFKVYK